MVHLDRDVPELRAAFTLIEAFLETERQQRKIPGLSASIVYDQEIIWSKGFGFANIEKRIPATPQTIYRIASITKLFTATMLMPLRDAGKLHLDEPVEKYLPTFKIKTSFADPAPITLRQVVSHLSGLPRDAPVDREYEENSVLLPSTEQTLASLEQVELIAAPMTKPLYSNLGFAILGYVLGLIAGQPYTQYVTEHILHPLGMNNSGYEPPTEAMQAHLATGYNAQRENETAPIAAPVTVERGQNPAGGLFSSVKDIARFISLQFRDGPASGAQVLKGSTLREMHAPVFLQADWREATGIAWGIRRIQDYTAVRHSGGIFGFSTDVIILPELKLGIALFINTAQDAGWLNRSALEIGLPVFTRILKRQQEATKQDPGGEVDFHAWQPPISSSE